MTDDMIKRPSSNGEPGSTEADDKTERRPAGVTHSDGSTFSDGSGYQLSEAQREWLRRTQNEKAQAD